jgi:hypothetical protein
MTILEAFSSPGRTETYIWNKEEIGYVQMKRSFSTN